MAKQFVAEESEIEAVAREIFTATAIQHLGRSTPEHIAVQAFDCAEVFVEYKRQRRQSTGKQNQKSQEGEP